MVSSHHNKGGSDMIQKIFSSFNKFERSDKDISSRGGLVLFDGFLKSLKLDGLFSSLLPVPGSNRGKPAWDFIRCLSLLQYGGGSHLSDLRELRDDKALLRSSGIGFIPSDSAAGDWLLRMGQKGGIEGMSQAQAETVRQLLRHDRHDSYDMYIDPSIIDLGDKSNAKRVYTGVKGDRPIVVGLKEFPLLVHSEYREGNAMGGTLSALRKAFGTVESAGKKVGHVSADSEMYAADVLNWLSEKTTWAVAARQDDTVKEEIQCIPEEAWKPFYTKDGLRNGREIAITTHAMQETEAFTLVVLRWANKNKNLFEDSPYIYHAIATNMDVDPDKGIPLEKRTVSDGCRVVWKYNERVQVENMIKELKIGFGMESMPCGEFEANSMWFAIGVFTYNMLVAQKHLVLPDGMRKETIRTLRWKLVHIPIWIASHAGRTVLKISASMEKFSLFRLIAERTGKLAEVT